MTSINNDPENMPEQAVHQVLSADGGTVVESAYVDGMGEDGSEHLAIGRGGEGGRTARVAADASGVVASHIEDHASDRDARELRTAQGPLDRLNLNQPAHRWGDLELSQAGSRDEQGVDCVAHRPAGDLKIQVTMTEGRTLWEALAREPVIDRTRSQDQVVEAIHAAIAAKLTRASRDVVLALDATDCPDAALRSVVSAFRARYGQWASTTGFEQIWLVGPVVDLVHRLDGGER